MFLALPFFRSHGPGWCDPGVFLILCVFSCLIVIDSFFLPGASTFSHNVLSNWRVFYGVTVLFIRLGGIYLVVSRIDVS